MPADDQVGCSALFILFGKTSEEAACACCYPMLVPSSLPGGFVIRLEITSICVFS